HEELGELSWTLSEYPVGIQNFKETDVGEHIVVSDFEYGLEHVAEYDGDYRDHPENLADWLKEQAENGDIFTEPEIVELLVGWFHYYYEDPANSVSYNSREGGYLWVLGPYSAEDELRETFEGLVSESVIGMAVEEVQSDGIYDWAPTHNHPERESLDDEAMAEAFEEKEPQPTFDELLPQAAANSAPIFGTPQEITARKLLLEQASALREALPEPVVHGGLGHNQPPDEFSLENEQIVELRDRLDLIEAEVRKPTPDVEIVAQETSLFWTIISWAAKKADKTVDSFCSAFGATAGKAAAAAIPVALLASPYWDKIVAFATAAKDWLAVVLGV
ncbi:MAG: hypothetical protein AAFO77_04505, partial [Pseudomonadota bacterium]